jgi:hypothetical protein
LEGLNISPKTITSNFEASFSIVLVGYLAFYVFVFGVNGSVEL